ncbi:hypothetical protein LSCM1_06723 [Leishmania martiniquensis]|uniref:PDZ domain-containing protein n=1 Tax=Leishmania martiniquensis TaxID=1580590 RepID=A0A836GFJ1_9TRYP|nr:hypothetical protein LSCM1_06723 [Leishmania martiniquensis]
MGSRDADLYSNVANVLEMLQDAVGTYMSLMQDKEENDRECCGGSASASFSSLPTSSVTDLAIARQQIKVHVPHLLSLCVSLRNILRRVALLARQPSRGGDREPLSASEIEGSPTMAAARTEAVCELITRKLGDIVENADMIRGLVKLQQQYLLTSKASDTAPLDFPDDGDDDGPLRMKQLIRVTLYSLEDTEQLLRANYPDAASAGDAVRDKDSEDDKSPPLPHASAVRCPPTYPHGQRLGVDGGGADLHGSAARGQSNSSGDVGAHSTSVTPRSSSHTAPYVRRSSSLGPASSVNGSWAAPYQSGHNSDSEAVPALHQPHPFPASSAGVDLPTSIPAQSPRSGPPSVSSSSPVTSTQKPSSPRVRFAIDEPPASGDHDSSLSESALAATVTPQQSSRCNSDLLSSPPLRDNSTDSDEISRSVDSSASQTPFCSRPLLGGDVGDSMQPAPFGHRRSSPTSARQSSISASTVSAVVTETQSIDTAFATPTTAEVRQPTVPLDTCSEPALADSVTASQLCRADVDDAPPPSCSGGNSVGGRGGVGRALPPPVGLPPRSPRRQDPQRLSMSLPSSCSEQRADPETAPAVVDPDARVTTRHVQRLPGALWGVIIARHRAEMEDVLREDVLDLFNYGEVSPVLRSEDVREVSFTVVGNYLYSRIQLEHLCSLAESEINTRLDLCSYPLMMALYEELFKERQAKELDPIEDEVATRGKDPLHYRDMRRIAGGDGRGKGGNEEEKRPSNESLEQGPPGLSGYLNAAKVAADDSTAAARTSTLSIDAGPLTTLVMGDVAAASDVSSMWSVIATVGGGIGNVGRSGAEAFSAASSGLVSTEESTLLQKRAVAASAARHPHTVRIPGAHWARLLMSSVAKNNLSSAFVQDTGTALGVLPSEARAACQEVHFSCGSLVVMFVWDNSELYPGAVPLSAPEIDSMLQSCPYPSVRAYYAKACTTLGLDDDLAVAPSPKGCGISGSGGAADSGALQATPPYNSARGSFSVAQKAPASDVRVRAEMKEARVITKPIEEGRPSRATEAAPLPPQHHRGVHALRLSRIESAASNASAGAVPLVAVSPPAVKHSIYSSKSQRGLSVRSPAGTPQRWNVADADSPGSNAAARRTKPNGSQAPVTLGRLALFYGLSVSALRQRSPALAELDADAVIPADATVHVPRHSSSPIRLGGEAGVSVASGAGFHRDPADNAPAAMKGTTSQSPSARLPSLAASSSTKVAAAAAAAPLTVSAPNSSAPAQAAPKPPPPPANKPERAKSSTTITVSKRKSIAPVVASSRRRLTRSIESVETRCDSLTPATPLRASIPAGVAAAASASPVVATRSHSPSPETPSTAGSKGSPAANKGAEAPFESGAAFTEQTAPFLPIEPFPTATTAREVSPRVPQSVRSTSTTAAAGSKAPPAHIVYRLPESQTSQSAESRGVEAILAAHKIPRLPLGAVALQATTAVNDSARGQAVGEDPPGHQSRGKETGRLEPQWERDLGLRLDTLTVVQVRRGSVAARANIQPGDTLRTLNGEVLLSQSDFQRTMVQQQQRHRKEGGERTVFVTAMTSRGTPSTYRLRLPPPPCDGAATQPDLPQARSARPTLPLKTSRPLLPLSARVGSAARGTLPQQPWGMQRPLQASPRALVGLATAMSARTDVSSIFASAQGARTRPSTTSALQLRRTKLPDAAHSPAAHGGRVLSGCQGLLAK